jgi:hypothetical protein
MQPSPSRRMLEARIHCTGPDCDAIVEVPVEDLDELEGFVCGCGYGYVLLAVVSLEPV